MRYGGLYNKYSIFRINRIRTNCRLGGGCSILLSYGDRVDRQSSFYPFSLRLSIREKEESRRRLSSFGLLYSMTRTRMTLGRWVTSLMTACSTLDPRSTRV